MGLIREGSSIVIIDLIPEDAQAQHCGVEKERKIVQEECIVERKFLSIVFLEHVDWLSVLVPRVAALSTCYQGNFEFAKVMANRLSKVFIVLEDVQRIVLLNDSCFLKPVEIYLVFKQLHHSSLSLPGVKSSEFILHVLIIRNSNGCTVKVSINPPNACNHVKSILRELDANLDFTSCVVGGIKVLEEAFIFLIDKEVFILDKLNINKSVSYNIDPGIIFMLNVANYDIVCGKL